VHVALLNTSLNECENTVSELVLTNEWGWEDAVCAQQMCTIVRFDQYRVMYKLDHQRPPFNTYYYRYMLDNDSRIDRKPVVLLYNQLRPDLKARSLPGPTDEGLCTGKAFELMSSRLWLRVRKCLQHRGIKGMVSMDATPEYLAAVAHQLPGAAAHTTSCVLIHQGIVSWLLINW
jgi:hypothetical protein